MGFALNPVRTAGYRLLVSSLSSARSLAIPMSMGVGRARTIGGDW
jgi:hypothetical protein